MKLISRNKIKLIKIVTTNVLSNSTVHALPNLARTKSVPIIALWSLFLLLSAVSCAYLVSVSITTYFEYNSNTKIDIVFENSPEFPEIAVCNLNMFTTLYAFNFLNDLLHKNGLNSTKDFYYVQVYAKSIAKKSTPEKQRNLSFSKDNFILDCVFNYEKCGIDNFTAYFDKMYGNCYKFNHVSHSYMTGLNYGLNLILNAGFDESLQLVNENVGALIRINNGTNSTSTLQSTLNINLAPGFKTTLLLDRQFEKHLPKPYSSCEVLSEVTTEEFEGSQFYDLLIKHNFRYRQQDCLQLCFQKISIDECNCTDPEMISLFEYVNDCSNKKEFNCSINTYYQFLKTYNIKDDMCSRQCPMECEKSEFLVTQSLSQINSILIRNKFPWLFTNKSLNSNSVDNSIVQVNINYNSFAYKIIRDSPSMDFGSMLSEIGGTLGLFLGLSLLSLVEVLEIIVEIFTILFNRS